MAAIPKIPTAIKQVAARNDFMEMFTLLLLQNIKLKKKISLCAYLLFIGL
jgi:hypothetical protein